MQRQPLKPCMGTACPNLVPIGTKYCEACVEKLPKWPCTNLRKTGCSGLAKPPSKVCPKCKAEWERTAHARRLRRTMDEGRGSSTDRGYGIHWQMKRRKKLYLNPMCEPCEKRGILRPAVEVHHIDGNTWNRSNDNLMSVCKDCHRLEDRKHRNGLIPRGGRADAKR